MARSHGWMWIQGGNSEIDRPEWIAWEKNARIVTSGGEWFKGQAYTRYPTKDQVLEAGPELVLDGWIPPEPIILPTTRVLAMGSCFASHFAEWLVANDYNQAFAEPCQALLRNPYENVAVIAQQFRWAFGEVNPDDLLWIGKDKQRILATEERRLAMRQSLLAADVLVATLSLSEIWYDKITGEPLWRVATVDCHDPRRHAFKVLSFAETMHAFNEIDRIRAQWLPNLRIIYTVSPMPITATFRPVSAVTAGSASKAIVRGALDEFLRSRPDDLNRTYFYYPGYEIVTALLGQPFLPDNRHLHDYAIDIVLSLFARTYTTRRSEAHARTGGTPQWLDAVGGQASLARLEQRNIDLQRICDERLVVIEQLKAACDERLEIINSMSSSPPPAGAPGRLVGLIRRLQAFALRR
jgi:GSCFA family